MARRSNGSQNLQRTDPTGIDPSAAFTMVLSVYVDGVASANQGLFALGNASTDTARGFNLITRTDGRLDFRFAGGVSADSSAGVITDDTWYRIAVTYDPADTNRIRVGVNGSQVRQNVGDAIADITTGDVIAFMTAGSAIADPVTGAVAGFAWLQGTVLSIADADTLAQDLCDALASYPTETQALYLFQNADPGEDISGVGNDLTNNSTTNETDPAWVPSSCAVGPSAAVTGTATSAMTEQDVRDGGKTIVLTLTDDTWVASGATFDAQRQAIIDGLDAATSPTNGWNNEVRDVMGVSSVVRTSGTVVTITLPATPDYQITATETITVTVPGAALTGGSPITATPTFTVVRGADDLVQPVGLTNSSGNPATSSGSMTSDAVGLTRLVATVGGVALAPIVITKR